MCEDHRMFIHDQMPIISWECSPEFMYSFMQWPWTDTTAQEATDACFFYMAG
jgi:hypothetical protein